MKVRIVLDLKTTKLGFLQYFYNKALAPIGTILIMAWAITGNGILALIGGILTTLGFMTNIYFEGEGPKE